MLCWSSDSWVGFKRYFSFTQKKLLQSIFLDSFSDTVLDPVGGECPCVFNTFFVYYKKFSAAGLIGSVAACECEIDGNVPIEPLDVEKKLDSIDKQSSYG